VIENLRALGYTVEAIQKGTRNAKRRKELEGRIYNRAFTTFTTADGQLKFQTPTKVYHIEATESSSSWIALDIANGASYTACRLKSFASVNGLKDEDVMEMVEGMLYETIAGEIVSKEKIKLGGYPGIDITNRTRRGDFQRQRIIILPEEVLVLRLSAPGQKVKQGYGDAFFEKVEIVGAEEDDSPWQSPDGAISWQIPGHRVYYNNEIEFMRSPDLQVIAGDMNEDCYYLLQRHVIEDPGFLDEERYELERLMRAFCEDRMIKPLETRFTTLQGLPALDAKLSDGTNTVRVRFIIQGLCYYAASTNDADSARAIQKLNSIVLAVPSHESFSTYTNDELFFSVDLPYSPEPSIVPTEMMYFNPEPVPDPNSPFGTNGAYVLNPPGEAAKIVVDFQRYHEFSDGEDTLSFASEKRDLVLGIDMKLLSKSERWTLNGAEFNYTVGDTATSRVYRHRMILHNKSFYHLSTSYDSILGPGDFVVRAFDSFKTTDTIFSYPHFECRDKAYLEALLSNDSIARDKALRITSEMDFSAQSGSLIRNALEKMSGYDVDSDHMIRSKLIYGLSSDTSAANIAFITKEFNSHLDSAEYQLDLLTVLLQMKTKAAWQAYRDLVVEEPPIVFDEMGGSGCELLFDSVRLAAPLIPDLMQLLAIDEYEGSIYHLMAMAADSGWLKPDVYRYQMPQLLVEARNELKRLNSNSEDLYLFTTEALLDYCSLFKPLRKQKEVDAFFKKIYGTKKISLLLDLITHDFDGMASNDSLIRKVAKNDAFVFDLYRALKQNGKTSHMPEPYTTREKFIDIYLRQGDDDEANAIDSLVLVSQFSKSIRGVPLQVYYYKIHRAKSNQWLGKVFAFDARDSKNLWPYFIESERNIVLDDDENVAEELDKEYFYLEEQNREYINFGAGGGDFNVQWY
jgi:hypothetical protein